VSDPTNERKSQHIRIITSDSEVDRRKFYFDAIRLQHRALPELNLTGIDPSVEFLGKRLSFPLLISSMTGADHDLLRAVNKNLATAAEATGVAMGVGSQRVMFTDPQARESFELRQYAPTALLFSNLGAVQLNYGFTIDHCREAISVLKADALYLHLNPLQEAVQPEGDTDFAGLAEKIGAVTRQLEKPVVLKEVGAGISDRDVELVIKHGIKYIDVAGSGGTSWSRIEHYRQPEEEKDDVGLLFQDWGNPTPLALRMLQPFHDRVTVIASGGIRSGIDMAKAIILGASLCGVAQPFLKPAMESPDKVIAVIKRMKREFTVAMFLLAVPNFEGLHNNSSLITESDF
jgi:isopentenyl-diphosphate delta-isomerase